MNMSRLVSIQRNGNAAILTLDNPPVNAFTRALAEATREALLTTPDAQRLIFTAAGRIFVAGADIREIERITRGELPPHMDYLNGLLNSIESSGRLVIMAINGPALGIGLELAMAGHYRLALSSATLGLPEVHLGLIPGAGGTVRLPRLIGPAAAEQLISSGIPIPASQALSLGLIDAVCESNLIEHALTITHGRPTGCPPDLLAAERARFSATLQSPRSRTLVHLFFAERELTKIPFLPPNTPALPITAASPTRLETPAGGLDLHPTPGRVTQIRATPQTPPPLLATALAHLKQLGQLPILCLHPTAWLSPSPASLPYALRPSDLTVLAVRGYNLPPESITPFQNAPS
ncbi:MAG: enoyl-CoA hydratase-related protein [Acidobacteriota bacterium]